jgi:hypothetical protein
VALKTALQFSSDYDSARDQIRRIGFSISGTQKVAQLLIMWANRSKPEHTRESMFAVVPTGNSVLIETIDLLTSSL